GEPDSYCVVKWRGVELGRTKTCLGTHEPTWDKDRFRLAFPDGSAEEARPLVIEVWGEDLPRGKGSFLGQV
ncbi:unnamed protein product, partial [Scytosiphon promiscuus]